MKWLLQSKTFLHGAWDCSSSTGIMSLKAAPVVARDSRAGIGMEPGVQPNGMRCDEYVTLNSELSRENRPFRYSGGANCNMSLSPRDILVRSTRGRPVRASWCSIAACRCVSIAQREHQQFYPQPGWVEHDPQEILERTLSSHLPTRSIRRISNRQTWQLIGIANQRETTVLWDRRTGDPVMNAIVWQDTRVNDRGVYIDCFQRGWINFAPATGTSRFAPISVG